MESEANPNEDWPSLESGIGSIIANRKSPSDLSRRKFKGLRDMLKMPKEKLQKEIAKECSAEGKFIHEHSKRTAASQMPIFKPSEIAVQFLAMNDIKPLKKRNTKFPRAQYFCHLCEYHCDTMEICISHIKDTRHSRLAKKQELETTLYHLPRAGRKHLDALETLLRQIELEVGLSSAQLSEREAIANRVDALLKPSIPGCFVRSYGSSMTGLGLQNSDLNLDLQIPSTIAPHEALIKAFQTLVHFGDTFCNVHPDFTAKIPAVSFQVNGIRCELSLNNHLAYQTSSLLRDYVQVDARAKTLLICLRYWASICKLDRQAEGTLPPHAFALLLIHHLQKLKVPLLPCIHDYLEQSPEPDYKTPIEALAQWKSENTSSTAELWIEFFELFSLGVLSGDNIISIRSRSNCTREDKQWKGKRLAIEDPFSTKRSLTRSVNNTLVLDFISDCFRIAYLYFGTVQTKLGPMVTKIIVPPSSKKNPRKNNRKAKLSQSDEKQSEAAGKPDDNVENLLNKLKLDSAETSSTSSPPVPISQAITLEELERSMIRDEPSSEDEDDSEDLPNPGEAFEMFAKRVGTELTPKQAKKITELVPKNMIHFEFNGYILTAGQSPIMICSVCGCEGHLQNKCPDEQLPVIRPLPDRNPGYMSMLNKVCFYVMERRIPSENENNGRKHVLDDLSEFVRKSYPTAVLTLFGSSVNGFSFSKSDLDISLTFTDHDTDENLNAIEIIENLAEKLKKKPSVLNVQAITSAKVPIIKFTNRQPKIECDISLYNILAQENTKMLRAYSCIDPRVKLLGYVVKEFAKRCDIGDASRGSLSSYAYILMLIYYLQQVQPPVVPVLQELYDDNVLASGQRPVKTVDGWNAWFFNDLGNLASVWPGLKANKMEVAELWLGFLHFYACQFDDARTVISIRMKRELSKFEKMWNSPCFAIEDPFDLSHNLGAGISRKMHLYIKSAFILTRELVGIPSQRIPMTKNIDVLKSYFFDPDLMTDGLPPNDRGCRACGKIGHLVRDCPKKKASDEHKKSKKDNKKPLPTTQHQQQQQQSSQKEPARLNPPPGLKPMDPQEIRNFGATPATPTSAGQPVLFPPPNLNQQPPPPADLIAFLQSGGILNQNIQNRPPPPSLGSLQQQLQIRETLRPPTDLPPLPALPNTAISVEDLERNLVSESSVSSAQPQNTPPILLPSLDQNLFWPNMPPILPNYAGNGSLWPPSSQQLPLAQLNSFGLGGPQQQAPPSFLQSTNQGFEPGLFGFAKPAGPPPPAQPEKPLQLNQLPGFNLFGGANNLFNVNPSAPDSSQS